ncbi:hypothetical protein PR048_021228 [Dryococelus australis]|uniref:DDE Tnp4 domain-containing protein n=1 Tax=Dryococelus australis TaxID=614101 RepID=A0ABQ9GXL6_9NEOP|nr:hypothetical protein PR048_021228 [Dryococelus australis]
MQRPYSGKNLSREKKTYNYRLSRARRYIECSFGILTKKWRISYRALNFNVNDTATLVKAYCAIHNGVDFDCNLSIIGLEEGDTNTTSEHAICINNQGKVCAFPLASLLPYVSLLVSQIVGPDFTSIMNLSESNNAVVYAQRGRHRLTVVVTISCHQKWLMCKILRDSVVASGGGDTPPLATVARVQAFSHLQCSLMGYYHPATESPVCRGLRDPLT